MTIPASARATAMTDENGSATNYSYESAPSTLDRLVKVARAAGSALETWTSYSYPTFPSPPTTVTVTQSQVTKTDAALHSKTQFDGFGRVILAKQFESPTVFIQTPTSYDGLGRVKTTTNPSRPGDSLGVRPDRSFTVRPDTWFTLFGGLSQRGRE